MRYRLSVAQGRVQIHDRVAELLEAVGVDGPPIPVDHVAFHLGAHIHREPLDDNGDLSGLLVRVGGKTIIGVNSRHSKTRQRFTIAHEIGHLVLHDHDKLYLDRDFPVRLRDERSSQAVDPDEIAANAFAAELLMPADMLKRDLRDVVTRNAERHAVDYEDEETIRRLAERYQVSLQAMIFRLVNLGLIDQAPDLRS